MPRRYLRLPSLLLATCLVCGVAAAPVAEALGSPAVHAEATSAEPSLPADSTTEHALELPGRTLRFSATAGAIRLRDDKGTPEADIAFIAYQLAGADRAKRPVTFVLNGGPGMASGWLQVGAVGPWRVPLGEGPSAPPMPIPNAETWLDFTDLVFIDPAGTGYSRLLGESAALRREFWSVDGDIASLAHAMRLWLDRYGRMTSPIYILGESYGGFRAPRLARALQSEEGVGVSGLVLVSPALVLGGRSDALDPLAAAVRLPSMTAAARAAKGPVTRAQLAEAEQYAGGDYLTDLLRGERDGAAVERRSARVAALTGLDPALVRRRGGEISVGTFLRELDRAHGRVGSRYDATMTIPDPFPSEPTHRYPDPVLDGLAAPISSAMAEIYAERLHWRPDATYRLANQAVSHNWDWGRGLTGPESLTTLQTALALDPRMHVLIAHGMFDLVTPYFATQLVLNQLPDSTAARVRLMVLPGGHMFYTLDASRAEFREAAQAIYGVMPRWPPATAG